MELATIKNEGQAHLVDLMAINKYVGYTTCKLAVSLSRTIGSLRQFRQQKNGSVKFPLQDLKLVRASGDLKIQTDFVYDSGAPIEILRDQILQVRALTVYGKK